MTLHATYAPLLDRLASIVLTHGSEPERFGFRPAMDAAGMQSVADRVQVQLPEDLHVLCGLSGGFRSSTQEFDLAAYARGATPLGPLMRCSTRADGTGWFLDPMGPRTAVWFMTPTHMILVAQDLVEFMTEFTRLAEEWQAFGQGSYEPMNQAVSHLQARPSAPQQLLRGELHPAERDFLLNLPDGTAVYDLRTTQSGVELPVLGPMRRIGGLVAATPHLPHPIEEGAIHGQDIGLSIAEAKEDIVLLDKEIAKAEKKKKQWWRFWDRK